MPGSGPAALNQEGVMRSRRIPLLTSVALAVIVTAALTAVPAALNSSTTNGLSAYVDTNARGQMPAGSVARQFVHVLNSNDIQPGPLGVRQTIANALGLEDYHLPDMEENAQISHAFYDNNLRGGEGHMEVGKLILNIAKAKATMTLSVKPFGCMPSAGVSDGVQSMIFAVRVFLMSSATCCAMLAAMLATVPWRG